MKPNDEIDIDIGGLFDGPDLTTAPTIKEEDGGNFITDSLNYLETGLDYIEGGLDIYHDIKDFVNPDSVDIKGEVAQDIHNQETTTLGTWFDRNFGGVMQGRVQQGMAPVLIVGGVLILILFLRK